MSQRVNHHNEKRKARFKAAGITEQDIQFAHADFVGEGESNCTLCDHEIGNLFRLEFRRPSGRVVFDPVGSKCITDWVKAMPPSPEREAALARIKEAERNMEALKAAKKDSDRAKEAETALLATLKPGDRRAIEDYLAFPDAARNPTLKDIAEKVLKFGSFASPAQWGLFQSLMRQVKSRAPAAAAPAPRPSTPATGQPRPAPAVEQFVPACPKCGGPTQVRQSKRGPFFGCVNYPRCQSVTPIFVPRGQHAPAYQAPPLPPPAQQGEMFEPQDDPLNPNHGEPDYEPDDGFNPDSRNYSGAPY